MAHLYFAYGSNLDHLQMTRRCPSSCFVSLAVLANHALTFPVASDGDWNGGVASVEPTPGAAVHGVVYAINDADLAKLDEYEAVAEGMYVRRRVEVQQADANPAEVWTYFAIPDPDGPTPPSRRYRDAILRGATHHGLPAAYLAKLAAIRTHD